MTSSKGKALKLSSVWQSKTCFAGADHSHTTSHTQVEVKSSHPKITQVRVKKYLVKRLLKY